MEPEEDKEYKPITLEELDNPLQMIEEASPQMEDNFKVLAKGYNSVTQVNFNEQEPVIAKAERINH